MINIIIIIIVVYFKYLNYNNIIKKNYFKTFFKFSKVEKSKIFNKGKRRNLIKQKKKEEGFNVIFTKWKKAE